MTAAIYKGKVRDIYELGEYLNMEATDRVSSFDKSLGIIEGKGELLNKMSAFWFNNTEHIIENHLIGTDRQFSIVKKCTPFKIEVVVRAYITGNTSTSLWTHYNKGVRNYCGIIFPDGLIKHQKLDNIVITPTTKGESDYPISKDDIIAQDYMTSYQWDYISKKAIELFEHGQKVADKAGFILVDTKYEFGKTKDGKVILIDELHTCDSSRFWIKDSYEKCMQNKQEPEKLDKDCIRDWVKSVCDPYHDVIPAIPEEIVQKAYKSYQHFYESLASLDKKEMLKLTEDTKNENNSDVIILSGSISDDNHVKKLETALIDKNISSKAFVLSAHKNTQAVIDLINNHKNQSRLIWVTVAGRSNALSGVVAANSKQPVIACPPFADKTDMLVNINSTLQCPSKVPVMTILEPGNVAGSIERMLNL